MRTSIGSTQKKLAVLSFIIYTVLILAASCKNDEDDREVSSEYLIETDSLKNNDNGILSFQKEVKVIIAAYKSLKGFSSINDAIQQPKKIFLETEIAKIFDAATTPCALPGKVKNKLTGKSFAPSWIKKQLETFPDSALSVDGQSVSVVLNTIAVKSTNGSSFTFPILNSPSFKSFDAKHYMISSGFNNFFYTLDCSGFLNAAVEASATATIVGGVDTNAKLSLESQNTMFVAGGTLASPVYTSYYNNAVGTELDTATMISILEAVLSIPNIKESDSVRVPSAYVVVWASRSGKGSFNGAGELSGTVGGGVGLASFSSSTRTGAQITRETSFSNYNTYIIDEEKLTKKQSISVKDIKDKVKAMKRN